MDRETYELVSMSYHALPFAQAPPLCKHHYLKAIVFRTMSYFAYSTPPPPVQAPLPGGTTVFCAFGGARAKGGGAFICLWQSTAICGCVVTMPQVP